MRCSNYREGHLSDAARARAALDGQRSGRADRAPRPVGHARRRLAGSARRARRGASPLRVRSHGRDSDRRTAARPATGSVRDRAAGRAHDRIVRCSVGSIRSTGVANAPIFSGTRSDCASTCSPSSMICSRSGVASLSNTMRLPASALRWDPVRPLIGAGDWLARVRWVDGRPGRDLRRWLRPPRKREAGQSRFLTCRRSGSRWWIDCSSRSRTARANRHCTRCCSRSAHGSRARSRPRAPGSACTTRCALSTSRSIPNYRGNID